MNVQREGYADYVGCLDSDLAFENAYVRVFENGVVELTKQDFEMWGHIANYEIVWVHENPTRGTVSILRGGEDGPKSA